MAAAELCGFKRDRRGPWRYHLRDGYDELLAIEVYVGDCQMVARAMEAASTFLRILDATREGQSDSAPRNPPDPAADGLQGAHHQAGEIPDGLPELVDGALDGPRPPGGGGMPGLQDIGLWGEVPRGATGQRGRDPGTHPHLGGGA